MGTIKSYTDIEQSKKLAEILPLESADMFLALNGLVPVMSKYIDNGLVTADETAIPCWSLAALLDVLPFHLIVNNQRYAFSMHKGLDKNGETYMIRYNIFDTDICLYKTKYYNSPVDACYEMVIKLNELKML